MMRNPTFCIALLQAVAFCFTSASNDSFTSPTNDSITSPTNDSFTSASNDSFTTVPDAPEADDVIPGKHESFQKCPKFGLDPDEYVSFPNGTVYVEAYNRTYTEEHYHLENDLLIVCVPTAEGEELGDKDEAENMLASYSLNMLTTIGISVSIVCLLLHLVVFALVPDLQNLPGCNMASLCSSLFLSYLFMILISSSEELPENRVACVAVAGLMQFFMLASFMWMFIMSFDVFRSILQATGSLRATSRSFRTKTYLYNSLIAWGASLTFTAAAHIIDNVDVVDEFFKPHFDEICWFKHKKSLLIFFAGPVFTLIFINFILFGISAYKIFANRMKSGKDSHQSHLRKSHLMYFRLAIIMGVTWITGAVAPLANVLWLWYLFAALNTLQGFFIFLAFTCTGKVRRHFKVKLFGDRRVSRTSLTPTFQSYCNYANSIEKDLEKVVDSKDKSEVVESVVMHI